MTVEVGKPQDKIPLPPVAGRLEKTDYLSPKPESPMLDAEQAAELMGISKRHWVQMNTDERVPEPVRFGSTVRWYLNELMAWLDAGAPMRADWQAMKLANGGRFR